MCPSYSSTDAGWTRADGASSTRSSKSSNPPRGAATSGRPTPPSFWRSRSRPATKVRNTLPSGNCPKVLKLTSPTWYI